MASKVAGDYLFIGNDLRFGELPTLAKVNGRLAFTEQDLQAQDVALEALGGPAKVAITSVDGEVRVAGSGTADLATLNRELSMPLLDRVSGITDWELSLTSRDDAVTWALASTLKGAVIDLPAPMGKTAAEIAPLKIERRAVAGRPKEDLVTADYRGVVRAIAHREAVAAGAVSTVDRVVILLGSAATGSERPARAGVFVRGNLPEFDVDAWLALYAKEKPRLASGEDTASGGYALTMNGVDLDVGKFVAIGRVMHDFHVTAQRAGVDWQLAMRGREVDGNATWRGPSAELPNGRVMARLTRFVPPGPGELHPVRSEPDPSTSAANPWPELDIVSDAFISKERDLGKFELVAKPVGSDWRIERLALANDDGRIDADGWWRVRGERQQTQFDVTIDVADAGGYLAHFGTAGAVRNAPTRIVGQLQWTGAPNDFDYPTLSGKFKLQSGAGQFTQDRSGNRQTARRAVAAGVAATHHARLSRCVQRRLRLRRHQWRFRHRQRPDAHGQPQARGAGGSGCHQGRHRPCPRDADADGPRAAGVEFERLGRVRLCCSSPIRWWARRLERARCWRRNSSNNPIDQMFSYDYRVTGPWVDPVVERVGGFGKAAQASPAFGSEAGEK